MKLSAVCMNSDDAFQSCKFYLCKDVREVSHKNHKSNLSVSRMPEVQEIKLFNLYLHIHVLFISQILIINGTINERKLN